MHPVLASRRRLLIYLAAWVPIVGLLAGVTGGSFGVLAPACLLYSFACLTPWYICRLRPLEIGSAPGLIAAHLVAASAGGALLTGCAAAAAVAFQMQAANWAPLWGMGALLYLVSVGLHYAALAGQAARDAERRAAESRTLAREAELLSLRMQINPHFLFNSLHSISALATLDGGRAREMCIRLAEFLRAGMSMGDRESIPLREELALARGYLEVEHVRFGDRLQVVEEIEPACEDCAVPALILQPLVENAVKHGIADLVEGGTVRLAARRLDDDLAITIENAVDSDVHARRNLGVGHAQVKRRLAARYGAAASFVAVPADGLYRVVLRLPCESPVASRNLA